ncbi:hypothetical protein EYR38_003341 [Pleurotus pulmonarius]|nr:hypothetical protein EYR38_003341 [Pleurotus pulmonarius]
MSQPPIRKIFKVPELHWMVIKYLSLQDLKSYALVCLATLRPIRPLLSASIDIDSVLGRYLPSDTIPYFRRVQRATGTLIGGSTALQLLLRVTYPDSDLDLYVNHLHGAELIFALETVLGCRKQATLAETDADGRHHLYLACAIEDVNDFEAPTGRKIQVIMTKAAPVQSILRYHSTAVMNFISSNYVYSLYGRETLDAFLSLYTRYGKDVVAARKKYEGRGWKTVSYILDSYTHGNRRHDFDSGNDGMGEESEGAQTDSEIEISSEASVSGDNAGSAVASRASSYPPACEVEVNRVGAYDFPDMDRQVDDEYTWILKLPPIPDPNAVPARVDQQPIPDPDVGPSRVDEEPLPDVSASPSRADEQPILDASADPSRVDQRPILDAGADPSRVGHGSIARSDRSKSGGLHSREVALRRERWGLGYHPSGHAFICGAYRPESPMM